VLLSQLRSRKGSILVISHDPELRGGHDFDSVWTVTKKDGRATVKARRA
jgi:DNA repair exonuclease SbcCD ATPase subunit